MIQALKINIGKYRKRKALERMLTRRRKMDAHILKLS